jgi:hypothetical protein
MYDLDIMIGGKRKIYEQNELVTSQLIISHRLMI